ADAGINDLLAVDVEQERVIPVLAVVVVALVRLLPADDLPLVFDQRRAFRDCLGREDAAAMDLRIADGERSRGAGGLWCGRHRVHRIDRSWRLSQKTPVDS